MKYRNVETGVILEPHSEVAQKALEENDQYIAIADDEGPKPKQRNRKAGE